MSFHVGQKVVCVDDSMRAFSRRRRRGWYDIWRKWKPLAHDLKKGAAYIITDVRIWRDDLDGEEKVLLHVDGARHLDEPWVGFPICQFRPITERKTDISIFNKLLEPSTTKVKEPV